MITFYKTSDLSPQVAGPENDTLGTQCTTNSCREQNESDRHGRLVT